MTSPPCNTCILFPICLSYLHKKQIEVVYPIPYTTISLTERFIKCSLLLSYIKETYQFKQPKKDKVKFIYDIVPAFKREL